MLLISAMISVLACLQGCGHACCEAQSLCEEFSVEGEDCEAAFRNAPSDFCDRAVETYEASCPGK